MYIITKKVERSCLQIAGKAYFDHPILHFYALGSGINHTNQNAIIAFRTSYQYLFFHTTLILQISASHISELLASSADLQPES